MRKQLCLAIVILLILSLPLVACSKSTPTSASETGFNNASGVAVGGKTRENINAKTLTVEQQNDLTVLTIKFVTGSKFSGSAGESAADGVPEYRAYCLPSPSRFVLEFNGLEYWDYDRTLKTLDNPLISGLFKQTFTKDNRVAIYLQLTNEITYKVEEKQDQLIVKFKSAGNNTADRYFVTGNAVSQFLDGTLPASAGLSPVLCDDFANTVLISKPFNTENDAQKFMTDLLAKYSNLSKDKFTVILLKGNALPAYDANLDYKYVSNKQVVKLNDKTYSLPVVMPDGLYLCTTPDGRKMLFSKQIETDPTDDDSFSENQDLWIVDLNGKQKRLTPFEFASIDKAEFSPDGKKLAILERSNETAYLYIYNMDTGELLNLGEEGFGSYTATFVWNNTGSAIYAISGADTMELHCYDFSIADETQRHFSVEDQQVLGTDLGFAGGELYFTDVTSDEINKVYKIRPEGGTRVEVTTGSSFRITTDGQQMAIIDNSKVEGASDYLELKIRNLATGVENVIVPKSGIYGLEWSPDGKKLFYIESDEFDSSYNGDDQTGSGDDTSDDAAATDPAETTVPEDTSTPAPGGDTGEESYAFHLKMYDFSNSTDSLVVDTIISEIYPSIQLGKLYMKFSDSTGLEPFRATYLLDINNLPK